MLTKLAPFYFLLGLAAVVLVALALSLRKSLSRRHRLPYVADEALFTPEQQAFLAVLERAVGDGYRVHGKVHVAAVLGVSERADRRSRERAYARISERCFDFLVCAAQTDEIACAVNLAPRSRFRKSPPKGALARVCAAARLPFVQFRESDLYSVVEIEEHVFGAMHALRADRGLRDRPGQDTRRTAFDDVSEAVVDHHGEPVVSRGPARESTPRKTTARDVPNIADPPRTEPRLALDGDFDEGPTFRIDDDLPDHDRAPFAHLGPPVAERLKPRKPHVAIGER